MTVCSGTMFRGTRLAISVIAISTIALWASVAPTKADTSGIDAPYQPVTFSENDILRNLVQEHLNDPDLWPVILRINGIDSVADLRPGVVLQMPVQQVAAADRALNTSLTSIQKATSVGARLFAPSEIGDAISNRDAAVSRRKDGDWAEVVSFSGLANKFALAAIDISLQQRNQAAEALVTDVHGDVEGREPSEVTWSNRALNDSLVEFERVRTLSDSTTQVTFRDLSRLRLNPNSNATIQRMRSDPLTGGEVTKVSLTNGDFYALLSQLSETSAFEIDIEGIETRTESSDFWVKQDASGTRFVNYDDATLDITQGSETIKVGANEGIVIDGNDAVRSDVLARPTLKAPALGGMVYGTTVLLEWEPFEGAAGYWFEVAQDPGFHHMKATEWGIRDTVFDVQSLERGRYHWRVAALDALGLPGEWSQTRVFSLQVDDAPPFLSLLAPASGALVNSPEIELFGASEKDAALTLGGTPISLNKDGSFVHMAMLQKGENTLVLKAIDPAGNQSEKTILVVYRPDERVTISLDTGMAQDKDAYVSRTDTLLISASSSANEGSDVVLKSDAGQTVARAKVLANGKILISAAATETPTIYHLDVLAPDGTAEGTVSLTSLRDSAPPDLKLSAPLPLATTDESLLISGVAKDARTLVLDGAPVPLVEGAFSISVELEHGKNFFDLQATDAAGNVSVLSLQTLYDIDPPEIISAEIRRSDGQDGPIEIVVQASDASGLRQAAPFLVMIGDRERDGFLRCDTTSGMCRATLPAEPGELELVEVVIEDYAGNEAIE